MMRSEHGTWSNQVVTPHGGQIFPPPDRKSGSMYYMYRLGFFLRKVSLYSDRDVGDGRCATHQNFAQLASDRHLDLDKYAVVCTEGR